MSMNKNFGFGKVHYQSGIFALFKWYVIIFISYHVNILGGFIIYGI